MSVDALRVIDGGLAAEPEGLPCLPEGELALVGTALLLADVVPVAEHVGIKPAAFHDARLGKVWAALVVLAKQGGAVDATTVGAMLESRGELSELGGWSWFSEVMGHALPTTMPVRDLCEQLKLLWDRRHLWRMGEKMKTLALEGVEDRGEWVAEVSEIGTRMITLGRRERRALVADHIAAVQKLLEGMMAGKVDKSAWVLSSLPTFNSRCKPYNSGIQDDGLVLVGGGSGTGKSVWLRQEAHAALAQGGGHVLFVSAESSTGGLCAMMAASAVGVDLNNIEREPKDRQDRFREELERMKSEWADKRLFVIQQGEGDDISFIEDVVDLVDVHVQRYGVPRLICVDYLQLFETRAQNARSREQVVAKVSGALQRMQRKLKNVVMVAAQLNESGRAEQLAAKRDTETGKLIHRLPVRGDLRESQKMYHDADRVIFLYLPPEDCRGEDQRQQGVLRPEVWVYQEKRRSGGIYSVKTWFEKRYTRFIEFSHKEVIEAEQAVAPAVPPGGMGKADWKKQTEGRR